MTTPGTFGGGEDLARLREVLAGWRTSLVDLSGRNRLLNFRHTRSATLEITSPSAEILAGGLVRGWDFAPLPDEEPESEEGDGGQPQRPVERVDRDGGIVTQKTTSPALHRALLSLRSKSTQLFNDYGLWTLHLGVGMLHWREDGAESGSDAPLILLPVRVERTAKGRVRLIANDEEEPRLNPALKVKLEQFHIDWTPVIEQEPTDIAGVLRAAASSVAGKPGWQVRPRAVVSLFASHKEAMYQDLLENESHVLGSDLVKAVALGPRAGLAPDRFDFEEIELDRIDELSPPEDSPLVLDADASQRQAVAAAVAGRSFVLDGPPGTGKSQTITNMIAGLMHAGRSVLFVSEKAAALDVVLDRLRSVGLDSYALALHSHNTSRRAVAQELGRALEEEPRAPQLSQQAIAQAREARVALNAYAEAMNEAREPLRQTLHDVIGQVGRLSDAPVAYLTTSAADAEQQEAFQAERLTARDLQLIVDATKAISVAWEAVADPTFPWRDLRAGEVHPRPALDQAKAALDGLTTAVARYPALAPDGELISDEPGLSRLKALLQLIDSRHEAPEHWLTNEDFTDVVDGPVDAFTVELRKVHRTQTAARAAAGERWEELSTRLTPEVGDKERALQALAPCGVDPLELTEERAGELSREFAAAADALDRMHQGLMGISQSMGLDTPGTFEGAKDVCRIVALAGGAHRPLEPWLHPAGLAEADQAAEGVTADALSAFFSRRDQVLSAQALATAQAGPGWADLGPDLATQPPASESALAQLQPAGLDATSLSWRRAGELAEWFDVLSRTVEVAGQRAASAAALLGCAEPATTAEAEELVALVELASASNRTLAAWLDPRVLLLVREAVAEIKDAARELAEAEQAARDTFRPESVSAPELRETVQRLLDGSRGIGGMLSGSVRADRKVIAGLTVTGVWRTELYEKLPLAVAWHSAYHRLRSLAIAHADLLGRYAGTELPDDAGLQDALAHAESVHRLAPGTVTDPYRRGLLAAQVADGNAPAAELLEQGAVLGGELRTWRMDLTRPYLSVNADELIKCTLGDAGNWLRAHLGPLHHAITLLDTVTTVGRRSDEAGAEHTLSSARTAIALAHAAQRETAAFDARQVADRQLLGPWYQGLGTDAGGLGVAAPGGASDWDSAHELLRRALDVSRQKQGSSATEQQRGLLGRYVDDGCPDTQALCTALDAARVVARLAPATLADPVRRTRLSESLADGRPVPGELLRQAERVRAELDDWHSQAQQPLLTAMASALLARPLDEVARWFRAHVEPFEDAADLIHSVARVADGSIGLPLSRARGAVRAVVTARAAEASFAENDATYRELLGDLYRGTDTDREQVLDALDWAQKVRRTAQGGRSAALSPEAARTMLTAAPDTSVARRHDEWVQQSATLAGFFEDERAESVRRGLGRSLHKARKLLTRLDDDPHGPEAWTTRADALNRLRRYGLEGLPAQLAQRDVSAEDFPAAVERAVLTAWVEHQLAVDVRLRPMRAIERDQLVERFRTADRDLVQAAHADVIAVCNSRRPRRTSVGQAAIIRRESEKQRKHMPVRRLLSEAREVTRLIKPCFMMSPLTVSQYLPPDFRFDVVIFDEASQVLPQDAVNSVYRGSALIVAGDQKQLPPTSFFSAAGDSDDDDEWDEDGSDGFESVLDACKASGVLRGLPLRWHYRSRHENLIAFSNHEFYDNSMVTFPGALEQSPDVGVEFFKSDGVYDRGGRSNNPGEAAMVAQRVIHHFATRPGRTLGVVALSKAQAEAIEEAVQKARAARPDLDRFFTDDRLDGFFVKNLETVQGDERDVIILSVGYGPDHQGKLRSTFGPINRDGGWRRLNVAVTRARRRMEVVASFYGGDLPDSANKSVWHLKRYLQYAQHGPQILQTEAADFDAEPESPFEEEVLAVLRDWGYSVQPQVGVAGFRIDMAVRHPGAPGTYALGIECDGAMYHSSRAARDRDRLRESVLRDLGWKLHRIWGTDWYRNRRDAMARLKAAVEAACAEDPHAVRADAVDAPAAAPEPDHDLVEERVAESAAVAASVVRVSASARVEFVTVDEGPSSWSREYEEAETAELVRIRIASARRRMLQGIELQDPEAADVVADVALHAIQVEGPIVEDLIFTRVRSAWGLARSGQIVQDRIREVLRRMVSRGTIVRIGTAYDRPGREVEFARTPTEWSERRVGLVPAVERQLALRRVAEEQLGVQREDLLREVARFFGWTRLGAEIRDALTGDVDELIEQGFVEETDGGLMPAQGD
ncbi:DUF3320 domain-containing protein [Streptomyces sp. NPDC055189]